MRESVRLRMNQIQPGWDCVVIARSPIRKATYGQIDGTIARLFGRAALLDTDQGRNDGRTREG